MPSLFKKRWLFDIRFNSGTATNDVVGLDRSILLVSTNRSSHLQDLLSPPKHDRNVHVQNLQQWWANRVPRSPPRRASVLRTARVLQTPACGGGRLSHGECSLAPDLVEDFKKRIMCESLLKEGDYNEGNCG